MAAEATTYLFMPPLVLLLLLHSPSSTSAEPPSSGGSSSNTATPATSVSPTLGAVLIVFVGLFFLSGLFFVALRRIIDSGCCGLRRGRVSLGGGGGPGRVRVPEGLSREAVQAIPTYFYKDVKMHRRVGKGELECAVCLSEFEDHEALRLLPKCSHVFHLNCVDPWLLSQATCPVCRTVLQPSKSMESEASDEHPDHVITIDHCSPFPPASNHSRLSDPDRRTEESTGSNSPEPHSTGHSPIWTVGRDDRFTLTLPAGEAATATWQRAMSQRKGYRARISWCCRAGLNRESEPDVSGFGGSCRVHTAPVSPVSDPTGVGYISS